MATRLRFVARPRLSAFMASLAMAAGCSVPPSDDGTNLAPLNSSRLAEQIAVDGFTCKNVEEMQTLDSEQLLALRGELGQMIGDEEVLRLVDSHENCAEPETATGEGVLTQAITSQSKVEPIEKASNSGGVSGATYRDSASSNWMCNSGTSEFPADYVVEYRLGAAYSNVSRLRVSANNIWSKCYLPAASMSRIYSDDTVRMCVGYLHVFGCGAITPLPSDAKLWIQ